MIRQIVNRIVRYSFNGLNAAGRPVVNVLDCYVDENSIPDGRPEALAAAATIVTGAYQDLIYANLTNDYTFVETQWIDLTSWDGATGTRGPVAGKPTQGSSASAATPPQVAILVTKTLQSSRGTRNGRWYMSAIPEGVISESGIVDSSVVTGMQDGFDDFQAAITGGFTSPFALTITPGVTHFPYHVVGGVRVPDTTIVDGNEEWQGTFTDLENFAVQSRVATQRRRLRG